MGIMLIGHLILLITGLFGVSDGIWLTNTHNILNSGSFILANFGVYQLFSETTKRISRTVYVLLLGVGLLSIFPIGLNIYEFFLIASAFLIVKPLMDEGRKYVTGISFYSVSAAAHLLQAIFGFSITLHIIDNLCRIVFFGILFIILFDKVMSLMEASYHKSTRDALTGLYNRFYFYTTVSFLINDHKPISVIFFDLDNFKKLNDTLGHDEGDKALKAVASILREEAEEIGISGRYGGEEMVMLIEDSKINMSELTEKIRGRIEDETIVTASIGYASYEKGNSSDDLIKKADKAMYAAKKSGKNRSISFADLTEEQREVV
jgi:two-component system cell cycle response regulator